MLKKEEDEKEEEEKEKDEEEEEEKEKEEEEKKKTSLTSQGRSDNHIILKLTIAWWGRFINIGLYNSIAASALKKKWSLFLNVYATYFVYLFFKNTSIKIPFVMLNNSKLTITRKEKDKQLFSKN